MKNLILFLGFISSSLAVNFAHIGNHDQQIGTIGRIVGVWYGPVNINDSKVLMGFGSYFPSGWNANTIKFIGLMNCGALTYVPAGVQRMFPNLTAFDFHGCGIETLTANSFKGYENLQLISFIGGSLKSLPGNLFELTPLIRNFFAINNQISLISTVIFNHTPDLEMVDLSGNICIDDYAIFQDEIPSLVEEIRIHCSLNTTPSYPTTVQIT